MTTPYRFGLCAPAFPAPSPLHGLDGSVSTWLGGDGGFEAAVDATHSVWTFGDSYISADGSAARRVGRVIGSVVGIGSCLNGKWSSALYHGGTGGNVLPFFDDDANAVLNSRFAPQKPFTHNGRLYFVLVRVANAGPRFVPIGSSVARVNNPLDPPSAWRVDYLTLSHSASPAFGSEAFTFGSDLVLYGCQPGKITASKVPLAVLEITAPGGDLSAAVTSLDPSGRWLPGPPAADAPDAGFYTTSGFSVRYDSALSLWVLCYADTSAHGGFPPYCSVSTGTGPFGPWGEARRLYFPEMSPGNPLYHPDNVVYAPHENCDFEAEPGRGLMRLVYTVGSLSALTKGDEARQLADLSCYRVASSSFANPFT